MAIASITTRLENVQTAIAAVEAGQSFMMDGVQYTRANLNTLYQQERYLEGQLAKTNGQRPFMKTVNFSGMGYS